MAQTHGRGQRVYLITFGCQMNKLDSEIMLGELAKIGFGQAASAQEADLIIINTCSVRAQAENRVWSYLGHYARLKKEHPQLIIAVVGCMAQKEQEQIRRRMPHVDIVCGTSQFTEIAALVTKCREQKQALVATARRQQVQFERDVRTRPSPYQAFISIMRGCNRACAYCIVPHVRGPERSRPPAAIIAEAQRLVADGVKEITLLGQTVNSYGRDLSKTPPARCLADLLYQLAEIQGLARLRFVTSHPAAMSMALLEAMRAIPQVCPYLHLPAQSGSDRVLERMRRGYSVAEYEEWIARARSIVPHIELSGDFIVGFPGETEEDHQQTMELVQRVGYLNCFIFKYSPRPKTLAAVRYPDDVPDQTKRRRNQELLALQARISQERNEHWLGQCVPVLVEGPSKHDSRNLTGRSPSNQIVAFPGPASLTGQIVSVRITQVTALTLLGEMVNAASCRHDPAVPVSPKPQKASIDQS